MSLHNNLIDERSFPFNFDDSESWQRVYPDPHVDLKLILAYMDDKQILPDAFGLHDGGWRWVCANCEVTRAHELTDEECPNCGDVLCDYEPELRKDFADYTSTDADDDFSPMMHHALPAPEEMSPGLIQSLLLDSPMIVVQVGDLTKLAMAAGGMDLRWEICRAYVRLGAQPPAQYSELPDMAGESDTDAGRELIAICARSLAIAASWHSSRAARVLSLYGVNNK